MTNIPLPIQKKLESSLSMPKWVSNATQIKVETTKAFQQLPDHTIIIKTPFERFPVDETKSAPISEVIVKLGRPKGNGYLWDVYEATIQDPNTGNSLNNVVAKYTLPFTFGGLEYYDDWPSEDQSKQGIAFEAITREHEMYTEHLVDLQGTDIPIHYGTFKNSKRKAFCMILEDVGKPIGKIPALWTLTEPEKLRIKEIYKRMHKFDVLHWGIHRDHVCQRENDGEIRLIDFHRSDKTDKTVRLAWEQHEAENYLGLAKRMQYASFIAKFKEEAAKKKMEEGAVIVEKSNDIPNNKRKRDNA